MGKFPFLTVMNVIDNDIQGAGFVRHGLDGIGAQVDDNPVNLCGIRYHPGPGPDMRMDGDGRRDGCPDQF